MDPRLDFFLSRVASRLQRLRMAWVLVGIWLVLGISLLMFGLSRAYEPWVEKAIESNRSLYQSWLWGSLGALLSVIFAAWLVIRATYRNRKWLAHAVERRYPGLDQRLITAVSIPSEDVSGYLRRNLVDETILHAATHDWRLVVSNRRLLLAWCFQFLALIFAGFSLAFLIAGNRTTQIVQNGLAMLPSIQPHVVVEPGDSEIERGSACLISARYDARIPSHVTMRYRSEKAGENEVELERSLKDPIFAGYLARVDEDTTYQIVSDAYATREFRLRVFDYPALVQCDANIEPPAYADQPDRLVKNTRRVTVPEGTKLTWICQVNKPLKQVNLIAKDGSKQPMDLDSEKPLVYVITMVIDESQQWKLELLDDADRTSKIQETLSVKVIPNSPPDIKNESGRDLTVSPLEEVTVAARVREDFGIVRAGISYQIGVADETELELAVAAEVASQKRDGAKGDTGSLKEAMVRHKLDFETLQAEPDQLLSYYFWAEDRDRSGDIRRTESEIYFAEVRPFDEIFRQGQQPSSEPSSPSQSPSPQAQQAEELAELQKKIMSGTWNLLRQRTQALASDDVKLLGDSQSQAIEQTGELEEKIQDAQSRAHLDKAREAMANAVDRLTHAWREIQGVASSDGDLQGDQTPKSSAADTSTGRTTLREAFGHEQQAYEGLLRLRAREHQIVKSKSSKSRSSSASQKNRQRQIDQLKLDEENERYEEERQATPESEEEDREMRQVMNRLDELARRQQDLNRQLKDIEAAIQEAKTPEAKQELEEQLKRLRENQEELLRDTDELLERMQESQASSEQDAMKQAQQQVEQARDNVQEAAQSLSQAQPSASQALSAGTRAERGLDETREQLRAQSSQRFEDAMQSMLSEAKSLEEAQQQLKEKTLGEATASDSATSKSPTSAEAGNSERESAAANGGLRDTPDGEAPNSDLERERAWQAQREKLEKLLEQMQTTISDAEPSEPLLAEKLYESFRETQQLGLEQRLELVPRLIERGYEAPVRDTLNQLEEGVGQLRQGIETAAESVLGSEEAGLRRALNELKAAEERLRQELAANSPRQASDPNATEQRDVPARGSRNSENQADTASAAELGERQAGTEAGEPRASKASSPSESPAEPGASAQSPGSQSPGSSPTGIPSDSQSEAEPSTGGPGQASPSRSPSSSSENGRRPTSNTAQGTPSPSSTAPSSDRDGPRRSANTGGGPSLGADSYDGGVRGFEMPNLEGPFVGGGFVDWSDALREVEESVRDPELRASASAIRQAARELYRESKRHSKTPQWDLIQEMVAKPLAQLREEVQVELLRRSADRNSVVPIDRDPVPPAFEEQLRGYYENLSSLTNAQ